MDRIFKLSDQEKEIVKEIRRKNFYSAVVPLSLGNIIICRMLIVRGRISSKYSLLKYTGAVTLGFMIGRASLPGQIARELALRCPEGEFMKLNEKMNNLPAEERRNLLTKIRKGEQLSQDLLAGFQSAPQDAEQPSTTEPVLESTDQQASGGQPQKTDSDKPSFSYAEQRGNYNNSASRNISQGTAQPQTPASGSPSFSYAEQRAKQNYPETTYKNKGPSNRDQSSPPSEPRSIDYNFSQPNDRPDRKPTPEDLPSSSGHARRARRNQYGDEME
ncbi:uncharacterized protein LOC132734208 isoform X1 [Ruditapes philippinarum]|uniref:uncharacterized protein LOC132734208 isoform X1 n=1 Tax=Ruditapes philippinarum TaxID=129788 RepID=UPI00295BD1D7|nr:uncharacterized protein LOC132734208 isoform X1 [Ruditapes philippinarum]